MKMVAMPSVKNHQLCFMSALQELGKRILSTSEDMEQRMVDRFQQQIDRLNEKISRLDYMDHAKPGSE